MIGASNMAPGSEHDHRSGVDADVEVDCPHCDGEGHFSWSDCCETAIKWGDICTKCLEHCSQPECETCDGLGEITLGEYKAIKEQEQADGEANE